MSLFVQLLEALRRAIGAGLKAVERRAFTEYDACNIKELSKRIEARGRKRLAVALHRNS
jgi:hypothetical protein